MWARRLKAVASSLRVPKIPTNGSKGTSEFICTGQLILTANTVVVAMSGGVDSSVTAKLLAEKVRRTLRTFFTLTDTFYLGLRPFCHIHAQLGHS
jgi:hypothetical protein